MKSSGAHLPRKPPCLLTLCALAAALSTSCETPKTIAQEPTAISVDRTAVKLGDEIHIKPTRPLEDWTGVATINTFRARLPIDSRNNIIRVTHENGFTTFSPSEICVALKDSKGHDIPVDHECVRVDVSAPKLLLEPQSETVNSMGGSGRIRVTPTSDGVWEIGDAPVWITLEKQYRPGFNPDIQYTVAENESYKSRSAAIAVGDATLVITQSGCPYVPLPFFADYSKPPIRAGELPAGDLQAGDSHDAPPQWAIEEQPGLNSSVQSADEGPSGSHALVLERLFSSDEPNATLVFLPGLLTDAGSRYRVALWLKAENPATVGVEFGQRTDPHDSCGLSQLFDVAAEWKRFTAVFEAGDARCGPDNNRLAILAGRVAGKLWISGLSVSTQ